MTKVKLHPALLEFSGAMGDMVFRKRNGKTFVSIKPDMSGNEPSPAQAEHRVRFKQAVRYSKSVMANPAARALYESASEQKGVPAFALGVADFLNLPSIEEVDLSGYLGQADDKIAIITSDDFGVVNVHVKIMNAAGTVIESGTAIESAPDTGNWEYTATDSLPVGMTVTVQVIATDRPGGTAISNNTKVI